MVSLTLNIETLMMVMTMLIKTQAKLPSTEAGPAPLKAGSVSIHQLGLQQRGSEIVFWYHTS